MDADVVIVGAGAAGLWAAERVARGGKSTILLEKTSRAGTKVLASGGSRCNLTTTLGPVDAARLFGPAERFLLPALRLLPPAAVRARFHALGVPTVTEDHLEKVFPASQRAVDVRDALLGAALTAGVRVRYGAAVSGITPLVGGGYAVQTEAGAVCAPKVILCPGGRSYPKTGTTGDGYGWLSSLGLPVERPVPALVPLTSDAGWVRDLAGISLQRVEARLVGRDKRLIARRRRPVVFTHQGLSGPGAMDLSAFVARDGPIYDVSLDLMPDRDLDQIRAELLAAAGAPGGPHLARIAGGEIPARLLAAVARQAGLDEDNPALHRVPKRERNKLADALKGLVVPISGTLGWEAAEVTAGGLSLGALDPESCEVRGLPGLYAAGEILDLWGPIGGLNFQAAFSTAETAARHILGR